MPKIVLIWDNDGSVMGSANPDDTSNNAKVLLPAVSATHELEPISKINS